MENEITLYHGSYCLIQEPKLSYCFKNRDFGQGFYLTTDYDQAKRFVGISIDKAASAMRVPPDTNVGYVNKYNSALTTPYCSTISRRQTRTG